MDSFDRSSPIVIALAKAVVAEVRAAYPEWREAFVRMQADPGSFEAKCSVVLPSRVEMVDVLAHKPWIREVMRLGSELREELPRSDEKFRVALLRVGADLTYEMQYDYENPSRWAMSKLQGGTGLPVGYEPA